MNVAVIPARGGSKRIPRKNIKEFCGKPIIAWPIEIAKKSQLFEHILVSTDDEEIAEVAKAYGADVPFMRPEDLANDFTGTTKVVAHAISWMDKHQFLLDSVCCIYPTAVFFSVADLEKGLHALDSGDWSFSLSVTDFESNIFRSFKEHRDGGLEMFFPECFETRSQDLSTALHDAAQFYWGKPSAWRNQMQIFGSFSYPIMLPRWRVQDIDSEDDWKRAEWLFARLMA